MIKRCLPFVAHLCLWTHNVFLEWINFHPRMYHSICICEEVAIITLCCVSVYLSSTDCRGTITCANSVGCVLREERERKGEDTRFLFFEFLYISIELFALTALLFSQFLARLNSAFLIWLYSWLQTAFGKWRQLAFA